MATSAKATGYLELNIAGFDQALKTAKNALAAFAAGFAAYKIGDFFKDGIKDAIDFGKEMQSLSRSMGGFDPGALLLTQKALEKAGMGASEAQGHIGDFVKEGRNVAELFGGADNYAKALKSASADYGAQAKVLHESGEKLQSVWNTMESIGSKVRTFFLTMTQEFVLPLQTALDYLNQLDLAGVGTAFGKAISDAATILLGVFKNGDIFEVMKLGLTVAFQEAVNFLAGGLNYIGNMSDTFIGGKMAGSFSKAGEVLAKIIQFVFSPEGLFTFAQGIVGIAMKFTTKILEGLNVIFRVMEAGMAYAIQSALENIPGLSSLTGIDPGQHQSFGDLYDGAKENAAIIPEGFIDAMRDGGTGMTGAFGDKFASLIGGVFGGGASGKFEKGNIFDTSEDAKKLQDAISKGFQTGTQMQEDSRGKHAGDEKGAKNVLTSFSGSSSKVIADSLAKVGGGGGFLRAGMSLQERSAMQTAMATKQTAETLKAMQADSKNKSRAPQPLGR